MNRILLYGATGFQGRLIADEAVRRRDAGRGDAELVLASRDARALREIAVARGLGHLAFALDERAPVVRALQPFDVVVNAAGPLADTAPRLAKAALDADCHYVDINGELDVYRALDDLAPIAQQRGLALVCGAGWTSCASDVLLDLALASLPAGAPQLLRIAVTQVPYLSRGSLRTMLRAVREQVTVVRGGRISHVPVGQLERSFDFVVDPQVPADDPARRRIASAANLLDTLSAKHTLARRANADVDIESYIEMGDALRATYQFGAAAAWTLQLPWLQRLGAWQLSLLPEGPSAGERDANRQTVVVEIDDRLREPRARWALETPDPYEFTARSVLEVAARLPAHARDRDAGWLTPSALLCADGNPLADAAAPAPPFEHCRLREGRRSPRPRHG